MGKVYFNGLHWNSPVDGPYAGTPQPQYNAGNGFASAFIIAAGNISYGNCSTAWNRWQDQCAWILQNGRRRSEIVLRLYWPAGNCMAGDPGPTLGQQFYYQIVEPAIDQFGIRNFQVLNELNIEYEPYKSRQQLGGDMFNIAWHIKHLSVTRNRGPVYLGFPGPGGDAANPATAAWHAYWDFYKTYITMGTEQGPAYNWLAVHAYEFSASGLYNRMKAQYDSLVSKLPQHPHRWTEYSIPLDVYCSLPCTDPTKFQQRANDCRSAVLSFKNYVDTRQPPGPDVWSVFYYLAYNSDAGSQAGQDTRYELVLNNSNLGPAQTLANAF